MSDAAARVGAAACAVAAADVAARAPQSAGAAATDPDQGAQQVGARLRHLQVAAQVAQERHCVLAYASWLEPQPLLDIKQGLRLNAMSCCQCCGGAKGIECARGHFCVWTDRPSANSMRMLTLTPSGLPSQIRPKEDQDGILASLSAADLENSLDLRPFMQRHPCAHKASCALAGDACMLETQRDGQGLSSGRNSI